MENEELIEEYFHKFNLDTRASENELDIAYEVLTSKKNVKLEEIKEYREAFEYLKTNFYKSVKVTNDNQIENDISICIQNIPEPIRDAFEYMEKKGTSLQDASKIIWSTQILSYPILLKKLVERQRRFLGFRFYTLNDISELLSESCLNSWLYRSISIEMSDYTGNWVSEIKNFAHSLQKIFSKGKSCAYFNLEETIYGVCMYVTLDKELLEHLSFLVEKKAKVLGCNLNMLVVKDKEG